MKEITVNDLAKAINKGQSVTVIDIREDYEFSVGHLSSNVIHIPMDQLTERINEIDKNTDTYLMCRSGKRAAALANYICSNFNTPRLGYVIGGITAYANEIDHSIEVQK